MYLGIYDELNVNVIDSDAMEDTTPWLSNQLQVLSLR